MKKYLLIFLAVVLAGLALYIKGCMAGRSTVTPPVLKPTDSAQVLIDPAHRRITTVTNKGTSVKTFPDVPTSILLRKNGDVVIASPQFGYEQRPFIGYGFANVWKGYFGCDMFFYKKLDIGPFVSFSPYHALDTLRLGGLVSYNFWSNTRIGIGWDFTGQINVLLSVRL